MDLRAFYVGVDRRITGWMAAHGITLLRLSLGLVFFWFGFLKFFTALSAAEDLASRTIALLTLGWIPPAVGLILLAVWETIVGLGLLLGVYLRAILLLLFLQMLGTITPLFLFPEETFVAFPYAPSLEGQYIVKNLVLISAGLVIGATVRGGRLVAETAKKGSS